MASYNSFYWDFLNINLDLQDNGDLLVTEEQKYVFNGEHSPERYRYIKLDKVKEIKDVRVFEDNHLLPIETFNKGDLFWIKWQEYLKDTDTHTFTLKYRAIGAIKNFNGTDKLEWKAIFPNRDASIDNSEITIDLPEFLADKVTSYYNVEGNFQQTGLDNNTLKFNSFHSLLPGQSSTIKLTFSGNTLNLKPIGRSTSSILILLLSCAIFIILYIVIIAIISTQYKNSGDRSESKYRSNNSSNYNSFGGCGGGCGGGG